MAKITNTFILNITSTEDSSNNVPVNRGVNAAFDENLADFVSYAIIPNAPTTIEFPSNITDAYQIYVRNLDSTNALNVSVTYHGGALTQIAQLKNGGTDFICLAVAPTGNGWTALSLAAVAATALCEYFIGG